MGQLQKVMRSPCVRLALGSGPFASLPGKGFRYLVIRLREAFRMFERRALKPPSGGHLALPTSSPCLSMRAAPFRSNPDWTAHWNFLVFRRCIGYAFTRVGRRLAILAVIAGSVRPGTSATPSTGAVGRHNLGWIEGYRRNFREASACPLSSW